MMEDMVLVQQQDDVQGATGRWPVPQRIERLFLDKGIIQSEIYHEASFLANRLMTWCFETR